jgi:hypothetical protein
VGRRAYVDGITRHNAARELPQAGFLASYSSSHS